MEKVSEQEAIARFAALMNGFIASPPEKARTIVDAVVEQFHSCRVRGVRDQFQFEWGESCPQRLNRFADIRTEKFDGWEDGRFRWIGVSRELVRTGEDDDTVLRAFLFFGPAAANEPSGTMVCRPETLDAQLGEFLGDARVAELLAERPSRIVAFASEVG